MAASTNGVTFRIAGIPATPHKVPRISREPMDIGESQEWASTPFDPKRSGAYSLPADVFLYDAVDLDPTRLDDVWSFADVLGGRPTARYPRFTDVYKRGEGAWDVYAAELAPLAEALGVRPPSQAGLRTRGIHVAEVALRMKLLRDLRDAAALEFVTDGEPSAGDFELMADAFFPVIERANLALLNFAPRLVLGMGEYGTVSIDNDVSGYDVAVLQAFNRITGDVEVKRCARPSCSRPYFVQRGRAVHAEEDSHRRSDSMYCSSMCARRVANSEYKKRLKARNGA